MTDSRSSRLSLNFADKSRSERDLFSRTLNNDPVIARAIEAELHRQQTQIELIASENIVSPAVLAAQGSVLTNKYAEGYPGRRYYGGCEHVDIVEAAAIERACALFGCGYTNVQPHSGAQANAAVQMALLMPGDTILGMSLASGGHLTHGAKPTLSGKWFNAVQYGVKEDDCSIDYEEVERLALEHRPKLIIAGGSAIPRVIDFARFREIADRSGALLMVDMAHYAGLIAAKAYPSPFPHAHVVTSTTHKTLRGPRGGIILTDDEALAKKFNSAVFPGMQGGPLMHVIAAKAVCFAEAATPGFAAYARSVIDNARILGDTLLQRGLQLVTGGTDCHLLLVDLRPKGVTGKDAEIRLEQAGLTANKNAIPFDPLPPSQSSGIRLGTSAATSRGFGGAEFETVGHLIADVIDAVATRSEANLESTIYDVTQSVRDLCEEFPIYGQLGEGGANR